MRISDRTKVVKPGTDGDDITMSEPQAELTILSRIVE